MENNFPINLKITYGVPLVRLRELHNLEYGEAEMPITRRIKTQMVNDGLCGGMGRTVDDYSRIVPFLNEQSANYYATELVRRMDLIIKYPEITPKFEILID